MRLLPWLRALALSSAAAVAVAASPAPAGAVAVTPTGSQLIHVNRCDPERSVTTSAPAYGYYGGFVPGYYGGPRYYWPDAYGNVFYQPPVSVQQNGTLYLDYRNISSTVMATIEFGLVVNGRLVAEVRDVGTFSPQAQIKHKFGLDPNVFPIQSALPHCLPLRITFKDGTSWTSPRLPALQAALYGPAQ